jgi:hypothetical protein
VAKYVCGGNLYKNPLPAARETVQLTRVSELRAPESRSNQVGIWGEFIIPLLGQLRLTRQEVFFTRIGADVEESTISELNEVMHSFMQKEALYVRVFHSFPDAT